MNEFLQRLQNQNTINTRLMEGNKKPQGHKANLHETKKSRKKKNQRTTLDAHSSIEMSENSIGWSSQGLSSPLC